MADNKINLSKTVKGSAGNYQIEIKNSGSGLKVTQYNEDKSKKLNDDYIIPDNTSYIEATKTVVNTYEINFVLNKKVEEFNNWDGNCV
jgi:hypothetical protein